MIYKNKRLILGLIIFSISTMMLIAEPSGVFFLNVLPSGSIPLQATINDTTDDYYRTGGGIGLRGEYFIPSFPHLMIGGGVDMNFAPSNPDVTNNESVIPFINATGEVGISIELSKNFTFGTAVLPGYYLYILDGTSGSGPFFGAEVTAHYRFSRNFSAGLAAQYKNYLFLEQSSSLYQGVSLGIGARISFLSETKSKLEIEKPRFPFVFPVFYKYYDENPVGEVVLRNGENGTIRNVTVSFYIKQYMDKPKPCVVLKELKPGDEVKIPLYALFTDNVLLISEGTRVMAQVLTSYEYQDSEILGERIESIEIQNRNAMTWDDDRKAASFVTAKDPRVLKFAKSLAAIANETEACEIDKNLMIGMAVFEGLNIAQINYSIDPSTPYSEFSRSEEYIDFLQFPSQTLQYKAGDCDDLSILFCALLESVGIETAFITIPGHIFPAFKLDYSQAEADWMFDSKDSVILYKDEIWVPVEVTMVKEGFIKALEMGVRKWGEYQKKGVAKFIPIHEAWRIYSPVGIHEYDSSEIQTPNISSVQEAYSETLDRFIRAETYSRVAQLQDKIDRNPGNPRFRNMLGILYARFGLIDDAEREINTALSINENYVPAIINMGNIMYTKQDFEMAIVYYSQALSMNKKNRTALVGLARAKYEAGNFNGASSAYEELKLVDSRIAAKFAYIGTPTEDKRRAGMESNSDGPVWAEE